MLTLNQIHAQIVALANAHYQISEVGMGTIAELQGKPDRSYPLLWLSNEGGSVEGNYKIDNIRLTMFGRVIVGEEGQDDDASEIEVLSDMQLILLDFLNYFHQQHGQEYVTDKAATLEHFTERTNDRTAGYSCVLELKQFYDWNKCQIPQSGATIPPSVDGLTLYDFCDQAVIDRLTADQVTCLQAELCTPCQPVTQQVNGTTIGTTASGGTNNQLIRNTAGSAVGTSANPSVIANTTLRNSATPTWTDSVVSGVTKTLAQGKALDSDGATTLLANYIPAADGFMFTCTPSPPCADATVTINGASLGATGTIPSGGSEDLDVLQGGVATGSWNGSAWIIPTCPVVPSLVVTLSDETPNFGDPVTITAVTNISATSYTFSVPLKDGSGHQIITQTGLGMNVLVWTAVYYGALNITVTATDGVSEPSDTVAVTVTYAFGNAATLNGSQWFTTITANVINDILNGRTWQVGLWFNATSLANIPILISQVAAGTNFLIEVDATHVYVYCGGLLTTYNVTVNTSQRNRILFQKTALGNNRIMYFNGVAIAPASGSSADLVYFNSGIYIGRYTTGGFEFVGKEKDVVAHQSFISSAAQELAYYNGGNGSHPSVLGKFPDWWLCLNSDGDDKGRLNQDVAGTNTPTFTAF